MTKIKGIQLSVSKFALPSPRKGSIDLNSGYGPAAETGTKIHQKIQSARKKQLPSYQSEVYISQNFQWAEFLFEISGRMDGFYPEPLPKIEEIKTCFNLQNQFIKLVETGENHPYALQLKTYGYFYWLKNNKIPTLNLHLVSSHSNEEIDYEVKFNIISFEEWLHNRSGELVSEAPLMENRIKLRKKTANNIKFPFEKPRLGQIQLIDKIEEAFQEKRPIMVQAPTGLGKTMGSLYPSLKEALTRGQQLIYLTPKNTQHKVAEDAICHLHEQSSDFISLTLTAKNKICFKDVPFCNSEYCEYAKDHYTKVSQHNVYAKLTNTLKLTALEIQKIAKKYQVCPYQIQLDLAAQVEVVICDYHYFLASHFLFEPHGMLVYKKVGKPNLIIDEVHNLLPRSMEYYSSSLSVITLKKMFEELENIPIKFRKEFQILLGQAIFLIEKYATHDCTEPQMIKVDLAAFESLDVLIKSFYARYMNSDIQIKTEDVVSKFSFYLGEFTNALEFAKNSENGFFIMFNPNPASIKIICCDASQMLKERYKECEHIVAISATLKPFEFYSQLSGLKENNPKTEEFNYPFPKSNRKILIIPQLSSKYSERTKNFPRIAETINKIISLKVGNYIAFFPSFSFIESVLEKFIVPAGFEIVNQKPFMRQDEIKNIICRLKDECQSHIIFAVQGGIFSEGVDYVGDMLIGAFVVGVPLPKLDFEREGMRKYYHDKYLLGYEYAYVYPAMAKAIQAAGRVIRSEKDLGIIVLMDDRFIHRDFIKSIPQDWFEETANELVSRSILKDISDFWTMP